MGRRSLLQVCLLLVAFFKDMSSLKIRNKMLGKCLQVSEERAGGRVSLEGCDPFSPLQEWLWLPEGHALRSHHTGECLTAPNASEGVRLQPCIFRSGVVIVDVGGEASSQAWSCSKKGHLTLKGSERHLTASHESSLVFLSGEHKRPGSRWRSLDNQTLCSGKGIKQDISQPQQQLGKTKPVISPSDASDTKRLAETYVATVGTAGTDSYHAGNMTHFFLSTKSPQDPTMIFFTIDYGMGWKITMLVLTSLALVLGAVILILSVYSNRKKKMVCVVKSFNPRPDMSAPGSPLLSERAPLTEHAMHLSHSSPYLQRGDILIEWKDGTVTPLYEA
uniref:Si:dkey-245n4.2 n=1 Tax=Oryzias latipes TaxID=8090 RepID=A0A3P9M0J8_ORYLA